MKSASIFSQLGVSPPIVDSLHPWWLSLESPVDDKVDLAKREEVEQGDRLSSNSIFQGQSLTMATLKGLVQKG